MFKNRYISWRRENLLVNTHNKRKSAINILYNLRAPVFQEKN